MSSIARRRAPARVRAGLAALLLAGAAGCGPAASPGPVPPASGAPATPPPGTTAPGVGAFAYQALWPFADATEVAAWQGAYRGGGSQPWHLDPGATASAFATGYLGFGELDRVTSTQVTASEAWVGVGQALPNGRNGTAAVVHLARWGTAPDAPWEVAGTRDGDTGLTLAEPAYGAVVTSPLAVGGTVSGVDEALRVEVHRPGSPSRIGVSCCVPAGGRDTPWSASVTFDAAATRTLTIVVSTGGHVAAVERFAVTGVRAG